MVARAGNRAQDTLKEIAEKKKQKTTDTRTILQNPVTTAGKHVTGQVVKDCEATEKARALTAAKKKQDQREAAASSAAKDAATMSSGLPLLLRLKGVDGGQLKEKVSKLTLQNLSNIVRCVNLLDPSADMKLTSDGRPKNKTQLIEGLCTYLGQEALLIWNLLPSDESEEQREQPVSQPQAMDTTEGE